MKKTQLKLFALLATGLFALTTNGQEHIKTPKHLNAPQPCGTTEYETALQKKFPHRATTPQFEAWLAPKVAALKAQHRNGTQDGPTIYTIPVVVHIIHNGDPIGTNENISDEQVLSQITVLNQDFRRMLDTPGYNDNPVGADMDIEFCLAQRDPNGLATTGIIRYNLGDDDGWSMDEVNNDLKPQTQWDPEQYLNIWVVDYMYVDLGPFGTAELAGFAQFPAESGLEGLDEQSPANQDGVAIGHKFFGSALIYPEGDYDPTDNQGRTSTHEVGHFFGLRHIWGDGGCNVDDFCDDTPIAADANHGCPQGQDSCPDSPGLDMIENYMDYTNDACKNIFTQDQKYRMMAVMQNSPRRVSLATSPGCIPGVTYDNDGSLNILNLNLENCSYDFAPTLTLFNAGNNTMTSATIAYNIDGQNQAAYSWAGSLQHGEQTTITLPFLTTSPGVHDFNIAVSDVNGLTDDTPLNDTKTSHFTAAGIDNFNTQHVTLTLQADDWGDEVSWEFMNGDGETVASGGPYNDNELYTETFNVEDNQCYTFAIHDAYGDGICCLSGQGYYNLKTDNGTTIAEGGNYGAGESKSFGVNLILGTNDIKDSFGNIKLYPNPANSILNIAIPSNISLPESYTLYNTLGQVLNSGTVSQSAFSIDISAYADGIYFVKLNKGENVKTLRFIKN